MKRNLLFILTALALILIIAGAAVLYPKLARDYRETQTVPTLTEAESSRAETDSEEVSAEAGESSSDEKASEDAEGSGDATETSESEAAGPAAPDFTVTDRDGRTVTFSELDGKPAVINFWATWCPYCVEELPEFQAAYETYGDEVNFMVIDLTDGQRETVELAADYIDENGYTFPIYFDTAFDAVNVYGAYSIPLTVFINADGTIFRGYRGAIDGSVLETCLGEISGKP